MKGVLTYIVQPVRRPRGGARRARNRRCDHTRRYHAGITYPPPAPLASHAGVPNTALDPVVATRTA